MPGMTFHAYVEMRDGLLGIPSRETRHRDRKICFVSEDQDVPGSFDEFIRVTSTSCYKLLHFSLVPVYMNQHRL